MKKILLTVITICLGFILAEQTYADQMAAVAPTHITQNTQTDKPVNANESDPFEGINRAMFTFNDKLDKYLLKPTATLYSKIIPHPLQRGISNAFANVANVPTIANDVLQANFYQASSDSWRLLVNTTAGVGGLYDVASHMGLEQNREDFGLTLAHWGYVDSDYLVLPFFGPTTVRDTIGMPIDYYAFSVYSRIDDIGTRNALYLLGAVSQRADLLQYQDVYNQIAIDPYALVRNAFYQKRQAEIERNKLLASPYDGQDDNQAQTSTSDQDSNDEDAAFATQAESSIQGSTSSNKQSDSNPAS